MKRRAFITLLSGAAAAWPLAARCAAIHKQDTGCWRAMARSQRRRRNLGVLMKAFSDLGYVQGKNIQLDQRFPAENPELFRKLGQELVDAHPALLIAITTIGAVTQVVCSIFGDNIGVFRGGDDRKNYTQAIA